MSTPTTWILGNWKQNHSRAEASACAEAIAAGLKAALANPHPSAPTVEAGIAPTYLALDAAGAHCGAKTGLRLLAQDVAAQESGAFTGEIGAKMLAEAGVELAIVGHSERRAYYGDDDALVASKVANALKHGLTVVLCVGESLDSRDAGTHEKTVISMMLASLSQVDPSDINERLVLAYEPVWAIGTGRTATPEQARDMHRALRAELAAKYGEAGRGRSILYGGSVKPANAADLISAGDIDGFLIGGASLKADSFLAIAAAAAQTARPS